MERVKLIEMLSLARERPMVTTWISHTFEMHQLEFHGVPSECRQLLVERDWDCQKKRSNTKRGKEFQSIEKLCSVPPSIYISMGKKREKRRTFWKVMLYWNRKMFYTAAKVYRDVCPGVSLQPLDIFVWLKRERERERPFFCCPQC